MKKFQTCITVMSVLALTIMILPTKGIPMIETSSDVDELVTDNLQRPIHRTKHYRRLDNLLSSLSKQLHRELKRTNKNIANTHNVKSKYVKGIKSLSNHIRKVKKHLKLARRNYHHYNRLRHAKYRDLHKLTKSLRIQRRYMNLERHYVMRMQRESYKFKHYPREYAAIKKEVKELKRQLNIELNDLHNAYKRLYAKLRSKTRNYNSHRHRALRRLRNHQNKYNRLVGRYRSVKRNYERRLKYLHKRLNANVTNKKQLYEELRLLDELRAILKSYNPKDYNSINAKYGKCKRELHSLNRRIKANNCTV